MRTEDGYIIHKCLNGEPEAFGFLVDKYREGIFAFAYTKLRNFHDAEDVTQEVFLKAYKKLRTMRRWDSFSAWLYSATSNMCKDWIRSQSRRSARDRKFIEDQDPAKTDYDSEDPVIELLNKSLDILPEVYQQVLMLYYFGGMNSVEIARFLGMSPTAVRQRLSRARSELKEEMLAMMRETFEQKKLAVGFTFRITEMVKRIKIHPAPQMKGLPWGLSLATGVFIAIFSLNPYLSFFSHISAPLYSPLPSEAKVLKVGEIPVDVLKISDISLISSQQGKGDGGEPAFTDQQNAFFMAPGGEGIKVPEKPSARLGKGTIGQIAYSPDGKLLAVAGGRGIWLYDADNLNEIGLLEGHAGVVTCVAFSPDGKTLASGSQDLTIRLWDVDGQKQVGLLQGNTNNVTSIAFSPDGKTLASGSWDTTARLWDVDGQKQVGLLVHTGGVWSVAFSSDGKTLASGVGWPDYSVCLWDVAGQKQIGLLQGHTELVECVTFSPDGKTLASCSEDKTIRLWDVDGQKQVGLLPGTYNGVVTFSPDGKTLASGGWGSPIRLWDVDGKKEIGLLQGHTYGVWSVAFSLDGKTLASSGRDSTIRLWDVAGQKQVGLLQGYTGGVWSVAFSPDGKILASGNIDGLVRLWDTAGQKQVGLLPGGVPPVAFSPDGKTLASGSWDGIRLWDVAGQKQVGLLKVVSVVRSVAFSPDGKTLASGSDDSTIRLWDVDGQKQVGLLQGHTSEVLSVAFSPDGKILASCGWDNTIRLWDVDKKKQIGLLQGLCVAESVAFSPDGKTLASCGCDFRLWDVDGQKQIGLLQGHTSEVHSVAFSPDGKTLASSSYDKTVRLWDVAEQKQIGLWHTGIVYSVAFRPDGKWLASGGLDGTILLWEMNLPGKPAKPAVELGGKQLVTWGKIKKTTLYQNFPNPFNPETWIPFSLSKPQHVIIKVYTSKGLLVRTLDLGEKPSGDYLGKEKSAYWDGRNEKGEIVASGIYFYVMEAGEYKESRKMVMVR